MAAVLVIACLVVTRLRRRSSAKNFSEFQRDDFLMHWVEKPGTSLEAMNRITIAASRNCDRFQGTELWCARRPRGRADEVVGVNFTELWISIEPTVDYEKTVAKIQEIVNGYPDCIATF
jgi:Cu/Ag efflux pump CusA